MSDQRAILAIVLSWNALAYTRRCLRSLLDVTVHPRLRILVVDNGSTDGTAKHVVELAGVELVRHSVNLGYARGVASGLARRAPGEDVLLLNNDCEAQDAGWLLRLQQTAHAAPDIGLAGCRLRQPDGTFLHAGTYMPEPSLRGMQIGGGERDIGQYADDDRTVEGVVFACVYVREEALDRVGGPDPAYFAYYEDTELCLRARKAGLRTVVCGSVTVVHQQHVSTSENGLNHEEVYEASRRIFARRWPSLRPARAEDRAPLVVRGAAGDAARFGRTVQELALALSIAGHPVSLEDTEAQDLRHEPGLRSDLDRVRHLRNAAPQRTAPVVAIGCAGGLADVVWLDATASDQDVREARAARRVWTPSAFDAAALATRGLDAEVVRLGYRPEYLHPRITTPSRSRRCTFVARTRTLPLGLVRAFLEEFSAADDVELVCHVDHAVRRRDIARALGASGATQRVAICATGGVPDHQLGVLLRAATCFVAVADDEPFDRGPLEAAGCGVPLLGTPAGLRAADLAPPAVTLVEPASLREGLRETFAARRDLGERGRAAAEQARATRTWADAAVDVGRRLTVLRHESPLAVA